MNVKSMDRWMDRRLEGLKDRRELRRGCIEIGLEVDFMQISRFERR